ncbi:hypothetical protein VaNZ11_013906 [Volvox africanus]|uniref:Uncharacterized protein n=1 Tax=Volvox africanus TaxID=51714 RepID=A0ABQ5SIL5_9CHLO|nr:hypothetical protein VaNZ11_013906 [Volvox africanus]
MGSHVPIAILTFLLLTSSAPCGSLQQLFYNLTGNFSQSGYELREIYNVSKELIQQRISVHKDAEAEEFGRSLDAICNKVTKDNFLQSMRASMGLLRRVAERDTIIAILGRRLVLVCLTLRRVMLKTELSEYDGETLFSDVAKELYAIHVESVIRKTLVDYLHISKSGGTSFSQAARLSKCKMGGGIGQPLYIGDLPRWLNRTVFQNVTNGVHMTWSLYGKIERGKVSGCERRIGNVSMQGMQYLSNEYTLHGGMNGMEGVHLCQQVVNVVTLRQAEARLVSHVHFLLAHIKVRLARSHRSTGLDLFQEKFCTNNVSMWEGLIPAILDNYNVRSFIGERAFHTTIWGIGRSHLELARRLLLQFDLVLDLDAGDAATDLLMYQGLGWNVTLAEVHARTADVVSSRTNYSRTECAIEKLLAEVLPRQGPDKELYSLGRTLSLLDQLLLGWAQEIGLRPEPGTSNATTVVPPTKTEPPIHCGLLDKKYRGAKVQPDGGAKNEEV